MSNRNEYHLRHDAQVHTGNLEEQYRLLCLFNVTDSTARWIVLGG